MVSPPPAKRHRPTPTPFPLTSLPDDILSQILLSLCHTPPDHPLLGRSLRQAAHAFSLAQCNLRLLRLFRTTCLTRIDGSHGPSIDAALLSNGTFARSPVQHPRHLHSVAWLAGPHLKELVLPPYGRILFSARHVLAAVADFCPNVERLAFPDSVDTPPELMEALFRRVSRRLRRLAISDLSRGTLEALLDAHDVRLSSLELEGVCFKAAPMILRLLRRKGLALTHLKVYFADLNAYTVVPIEPNGHVARFLEVLAGEMPVVLPNVQRLDLAVSCPTGFVHHHALDNVVFPDIVLDEVTAFFADNDDIMQGVQSKLRHLRIAASGESMLRQVRTFGRVITRNTVLETDFPGAGIVFPTWEKGGRRPYYRTLQLNRYSLVANVRAVDYSVFRGLEAVDIGVGAYLYDYRRWPRTYFDALQSLCHAAGDTLKFVRVSRSLDSKGTIMMYLADLLRHCPNVTQLEVSRDLLYYAANKVPDMPGLEDVLGGLESIRLNIPSMYEQHRLWSSSGVRSRFVPGSDALVRCLPAFLQMIEERFPKLRRVYLDKAGDYNRIVREGMNPSDLMETRYALGAIERFERLSDRVDFGTVKSQVAAWMNQCQ